VGEDYVNVSVDDGEPVVLAITNRTERYVLAEGLEPGIHHVPPAIPVPPNPAPTVLFDQEQRIRPSLSALKRPIYVTGSPVKGLSTGFSSSLPGDSGAGASGALSAVTSLLPGRLHLAGISCQQHNKADHHSRQHAAEAAEQRDQLGF